MLDRLRRRPDRRRGHPHPRAPVRHRPDRGRPPHPDRRPDVVAARRDHASSRSAACTGGSSPTSRARTGCSSGSAGRCSPTRPSSSSATAAIASTRPSRPRTRRPTTCAEAPNTRRDPRLGRRPEPVPAAGAHRAARQRDRQPHSCWSSPNTGSAPTRRCPICRPDDPFCEPRHVRLYPRAPGTTGTPSTTRRTNGLWLRMSQITVEAMVQFQIGEQRFRLKVL